MIKGIWLHLLQRSRMSMQSPLSHVNWKYSNYHCNVIVIVVFALDVVIIARRRKNKTNLVIIAIVVIGAILLLLKETKKPGRYCKWGDFVVIERNKTNLVIIASGHWKRKNGCLARAVQVVVDCPKMATLEKKQLCHYQSSTHKKKLLSICRDNY